MTLLRVTMIHDVESHQIKKKLPRLAKSRMDLWLFNRRPRLITVKEFSLREEANLETEKTFQ